MNKDIDIRAAEQIIAQKRKEEMDQYGVELSEWLKERGLRLDATIIIRNGQIFTNINLVRAAPKSDDRNGSK